MGKKIKKETIIEIGFYVFLFIILMWWSMMTGIGNAPDEKDRFAIANYIFNHWRLPAGWDMEVRIESWGFSYAFQPILSYMISALFMKVTALFTTSGYWYIIAARFVNVICGMIMAFFVRKTSRLMFVRKDIQWLFTVLVVFLPESMFMHVYVNTDSMALMSSAIIVCAWIQGMRYQWRYRDCILLSVGIICCALSYYNAYAFIMCSGIWFIVTFFTRKTDGKMTVSNIQWDWKPMLKKGMLIFAIVMAGVAWWFVRSYILYDGDFLGLEIRNKYGDMYAVEYLKPSKAHTYYIAHLSLFRMLAETDYIRMLYKSFIGVLGNMDLYIPSWIYYFYTAVYGIGAIGFCIQSKAKKLFDAKNKTFYGMLILCIIIPIALCTYSAYVIDYQPQGRYILPMLIPFVYFIAKGWENLVERFATFAAVKGQAEKGERIIRIVTGLLIMIVIVAVLHFFTSCIVVDRWDEFYTFFKENYFS